MFFGLATHYVTGQTWSYFAKSPHDGEYAKHGIIILLNPESNDE